MLPSSRKIVAPLAALLMALPSPVGAELIRNDSVDLGDQYTFVGGFRETEWFASTFEIPEELAPWVLCRIFLYMGPDPLPAPFLIRVWDDPADEEFNHVAILWDTDDDVFLVTGSPTNISAVDLRNRFINPFESTRVRLGFRYTEGHGDIIGPAADRDGFEPGMNHINAVVAGIDRQSQAWYSFEDLPEDDRPPGDWVLRLEIVADDEACPVDPRPFPDAGPVELPDAGPPPRRDTRPPPGRDTAGPPQRDVGTFDEELGEVGIELVIPAAVTNEANQTLALFGRGFDNSVAVKLRCEDCGAGGEELTAEAFEVRVRATKALHARVPAPDMRPGFYDIIVERGDGDHATLPLAFEVLELSEAAPRPRIDSVIPDRVPAGEPTEILVKGEHFIPGVVLRLDELDLANSTYLSGEHATAIVPGVIAAGVYDLTVQNPDGQAADPIAFRVGEEEPPGPPTAPSDGCSCRAAGSGRADLSLLRRLRQPWLIPWFLLAAPGCAGDTTPSAPEPTSTLPPPKGAIHRVDKTGADGAHTTVTAALAAASAGDGIAIAAGLYLEDVVVTKSLTIFGPTRGEAVIGGVASEGAVIQVPAGVKGVALARLIVEAPATAVALEEGAEASLSEVTIRSAGADAIRSTGGDLRMADVVIEGGAAAGVAAEGGTLVAERLEVRGTARHGVLLTAGAQGRLTSLKVSGVAAAGVEFRGAGGSIERSSIDGVAESESTRTGSCIAVVDTEEEVLVAGNRLKDCGLRGVRVFQGKARVERNDVLGAKLAGLTATNGSKATFVGNHVSGSKGAAITAGTGALIDQSEVVLERNTLSDSGLYGLRAELSTLEARGNVLRRNGRNGISILGGTSILEANVVEDHPDFGIFVSLEPVVTPEGSVLTVEGNQVRRSGGGGIVIDRSEVRVVVRRNRVEGTRFVDETAAGDGIFLHRVTGGALVAENELASNEGSGLLLDRSAAEVRGNTIRLNRVAGITLTPDSPEGTEIVDNALEGNSVAGLQIISAQASVTGNTITHSLVHADTGQGEGVLLVGAATATLDGNTILASARNGVLLLAGAHAMLSGNRISTNARFGLECLGAFVTETGSNVLVDNGLGATRGCIEPLGGR